MRNIGDYEWRQLSMWDFAPDKCVMKHVKSNDGEHIFRYYLLKVKEVVNDNHWKVETVISVGDVPNSVLKEYNDDYFIRDN